MTMPQDTFVRHMHSFDDVDIPPVEGRGDAIRRRIKRVRRRRAVLAGVAVIAIIVAGVAGAVALQNRAPRIPAAIPRSWTADDGVIYRRIGFVTLDTGKRKSVTVTIPARTAPIAILTLCDPRPDGLANLNFASVEAKIGAVTTTLAEPACSMADQRPVLDDLDVSTARMVNGKITFTIRGVVADAISGKKVYPARWSFGIYAWEIPHRLRVVPPPPPVPDISGWKLISTQVADWPAQRSVSFRVPKGARWGLAIFCTHAFAGAAIGDIDEPGSNLVTYGPNGRSAGVQCTHYAPNTAADLNAHEPIHNTVQGADRKAAVTIVVDFDFTAIYDQRGGVIEVGIYYKN